VRYEGTVTVAGHDATSAHAAAQVHLAYVPQRAPSLPVPVNELVRFWAEQRDVRPRELSTCCARLGLDLDAVWALPFPSLSGGMQQKLLAGMALASRCHGMLLDEPTANLDPGARAVFFADLAAREPPPTLLLSSHRLDELCPLVDRVIVLADGEVAFDDSLDRFLAEPTLAAAAGMETRAGATVLPYRRRP
jgi:ABC-2 type transport system ATP-binding protein